MKGPCSQTEKGVNVMSIRQGIRPALYSHSLGWEQGLKAEEDGLGPRSRVSPGNLSCVELSKDQAHPLDLLLRGWCAVLSNSVTRTSCNEKYFTGHLNLHGTLLYTSI